MLFQSTSTSTQKKINGENAHEQKLSYVFI